MKENKDCSRRGFLSAAFSSSAALTAGAMVCSLKGFAEGEKKISFVTANLVAQVTGYKFKLADWGEQHKKTVAATNEAAWRAICKEIASHGYKAIEIWEAHASPETMNKDRAAAWKKIMEENGL